MGQRGRGRDRAGARRRGRAAGPLDGPERFDVGNLLVATDGAVERFGHDLRRLRPNLLIGGVEVDAEPAWAGKALAVGDALVGIHSVRDRCVVTTIDPDSGTQDLDVLRRIRDEFDGQLVVNAWVIRPGPVRVGDPVELVESDAEAAHLGGWIAGAPYELRGSGRSVSAPFGRRGRGGLTMPPSSPAVEQYLAELSADRRAAIEAVRETVLANLPAGMEETVAWGMITYQIPLERSGPTYNGKPLMYAAIANQKQHMALYLTNVYADPDELERFRERYLATGKRLDMGKSCVRFRTLDDLPLDVVGETLGATSVEDFLAQVQR